MNKLINFDGLGEIIVNLTNKLSEGVGWIANRKTPKKVAINEYIKDIQESNYDPLIKAALISNAKKVIKGYCNQNNIVEVAIQSLQKEAEPEKVNDDWLGQFMDKARFVSSQEFQWIWGKILARECNKPGSIPLILLHTLEKMDKEDAEAFTALCRVSVQFDGEYAPIIRKDRFDEYQQFGITFDNLIDLKALGLIEMDFGALFSYTLTTDKIPAKILYHGIEYEHFESKTIRIGNVIFTKPGNALCKSIDVDGIDGFWEAYCLPFFKKKS